MTRLGVPGLGAWSSAKKIVALCFVAATLPLGIGVGILLAPAAVDRRPLSTVLASWAVVLLVLFSGGWLLRRRAAGASHGGAEGEDRVFGLLRNMSHELHTPLNSIIGFSELLLSETEATLSVRHRQYLADVLDSGQQLLGVVDDLLDLSKVATGALPLSPEALVPADLVANAFEALAVEAATRDVKLVAHHHNTGEAWGDRASLSKVLVHLVASSLRFSPAGATVEVETADEDRSISFSVHDEGPVRDQALAPGTSLGVVISRRLIEEHGGRLAVEPAPSGRGTTFRFAIPANATARRHSHLPPPAGAAS